VENEGHGLQDHEEEEGGAAGDEREEHHCEGTQGVGLG
jgi:hypothetical protein